MKNLSYFFFLLTHPLASWHLPWHLFSQVLCWESALQHEQEDSGLHSAPGTSSYSFSVLDKTKHNIYHIIVFLILCKVAGSSFKDLHCKILPGFYKTEQCFFAIIWSEFYYIYIYFSVYSQCKQWNRHTVSIYRFCLYLQHSLYCLTHQKVQAVAFSFQLHEGCAAVGVYFGTSITVS